MAQTGNHTPGPWVAERTLAPRGWIVSRKDDQYDVAIVRDGSGQPENEANARLIAASPEMLSELKRDLQFAREMRKLMEVLKGRGWVQYELAVQRIEALETIIAKAEGH